MAKYTTTTRTAVKQIFEELEVIMLDTDAYEKAWEQLDNRNHCPLSTSAELYMTNELKRRLNSLFELTAKLRRGEAPDIRPLIHELELIKGQMEETLLGGVMARPLANGPWMPNSTSWEDNVYNLLNCQIARHIHHLAKNFLKIARKAE